jgi:hypothetical protein
MTGAIKYFLLFTILITLNGCTVGRYVTDLSLNGVDSLAVEKCTTKRWDMFFWNTECRSTEVPLVFDNTNRASSENKNDDKTEPTVSRETNLINGNF